MGHGYRKEGKSEEDGTKKITRAKVLQLVLNMQHQESFQQGGPCRRNARWIRQYAYPLDRKDEKAGRFDGLKRYGKRETKVQGDDNTDRRSQMTIILNFVTISPKK